ncbi:MAG: septum formation protein Maf [Candidatus Diapherotrites archaeon]|nr:septum formation protein Maf [Candidatus Diapherotrites archaeon]
MKLILASQSPRRAQLLKEAGYKFKIIPSAYIENNFQIKNPQDLVKEHALNKARSVACKLSEGIVIGADTLVVIDDKLLGKPKNTEEAKEMLKTLSNKVNEVITGIALIDAKNKKEIIDFESTRVKIKKLTGKEIDGYVKKLKSSLFGFAAYAIQEMDKGWIEKIEGSYSNVVGLPMEKLKEMLKQFKC